MTHHSLSRRGFLAAAGARSAAAAAGCRAVPAAERPRVLRVAHLTDIHIDQRSDARMGMARALTHAQSQSDPPDFILNTGDSIMDSLATLGLQEEARALQRCLLEDVAGGPGAGRVSPRTLDFWRSALPRL